MGNCFSFQLSCDNLIIRAWDSAAKRTIRHICQLEDNLEALKTAVDELRDLKKDVLYRIKVEEGPQMKQLEQVTGWLSRVEATVTHADELIKDGPKEMEKVCLGGCCSTNCRSSYVFGKRVVKSLKEVDVLRKKGCFKEVLERAPTVSMALRPCESTVGLEAMLDKVWSSLMEEQVGIVGLYGMGGVGKTTLLAKINNRFHSASSDFNVMIWVVVSKDLRLEKIQEDIGKQIGFLDENWKQKSFHEKAVDILNVLHRKKFVLLLDDIWKRVDIVEIGVPKNQSGSKIIFTTRSEMICRQMEAQKRIKVDPLSWDKAWELFKEKVGEEIISIHPDILSIAQDVARECGGLPIALITIARAMACKTTPQEWKHAIEILRTSTSSLPSVEDEVFPLLKFSYDNLATDNVRSCFLYCALFPEDFKISKDTLIEYWFCEGFCNEYDDLLRAQNWGYDVVGTLVHACLLEEHGGDVKMHDVIRDMALWITYKYGKGKEKFLVQAGVQLREAPRIEEWKGISRMSLMDNKIRKLTQVPTCPNLLTLFLSQNPLFGSINVDFFQYMDALTVLDLSNSKIQELPHGISKLGSLAYFNLSYTRIEELPHEILMLGKLKYLNLDSIDKLRFIPRGVVRSLPLLQFLGMRGCEFGSKYGKEDNLLLDEDTGIEILQGLKNLKVFRVQISFASSIHKLPNATQSLRLQRLKGTTRLNVSLLAKMKHLDILSISGAVELEELSVVDEEEIEATSRISGLLRHQRVFNNLQAVWVFQCHNLCDLTWLVFLAPNLKDVFVEECSEMRQIISSKRLGEIVDLRENLENLFGKLQSLMLLNLPSLRSVCSIALPFPFLKKIQVYRCPVLEKLPLNSNSAKGTKVVIEGEQQWWKGLEWEDHASKTRFLPCFKHWTWQS